MIKVAILQFVVDPEDVGGIHIDRDELMSTVEDPDDVPIFGKLTEWDEESATVTVTLYVYGREYVPYIADIGAVEPVALASAYTMGLVKAAVASKLFQQVVRKWETCQVYAELMLRRHPNCRDAESVEDAVIAACLEELEALEADKY